MRITLINNSSDAYSYLSGQVVVPANGSLTVDQSFWFSLYLDVSFMSDVRKCNLQVSDGVNTYQHPQSEDYLRRAVTEDNEVNRDTDGALITRNKAARKGWTFCSLPIEFVTSRLQTGNIAPDDDMYCKDAAGNDRTFVTLKTYDASDVEITTTGLANVNLASAVKTVIDFEPPYDYEVIGGELRTLTAINVDLRLWLIAAPDVAAPLGSKEMGGGINLRYLAPGNVWAVDGRVTKYATYHPTLHTGKIRLLFKYPPGTAENIQILIQFYKA